MQPERRDKRILKGKLSRGGTLVEQTNLTNFEKIQEIIVEQIGCAPEKVTIEASLMKDLDADSLDAVEIIMAIEDCFGFEVPDDVAEKFQTIGDIVSFVESKL